MSPNRELLNVLRESDEAGQVAFARYLCEKVLSDCPDHGPTLVRYACCLIELALYDDASRVLDHAEVVVAKEHLHLVFAQRGHLLEHMGDYLAAESQHLKAHALDPKDATYLVFAGSVAFRRGNILRAEEFARKAIVCPEGCIDEAYFNLGGYLVAQKRYQEARECFLRALEIDPEYTLALKRLADVDLVLKERGEPGATDNPDDAQR